MCDKLMTFDEAYAQAADTGKKISVLLGNGFSIAYDSKRFSFTNLLESAKNSNIIPAESNLIKLFDALQTADFEYVIKSLETGKLVTQIYLSPYDISHITRDIKDLKKHLVNTVTNNHPDKSCDIPTAKSQKCATFLSKFAKIYTLNYDLLSYWVIMQHNLAFEDGFGGSEEEYVIYKEKDGHNLCFLHGALHIFDKATEAVKLCYNRTGDTLKKQIYTRLLKNIYPVFISEGTSDEKLVKIRHNYYLNHCFKSLKRQGGALFIFGTMLKSNDQHIKDAIIKGNFNQLYIGVWSEEDRRAAMFLKDEFVASGSEKDKRQAFLYDSKTVKPWG